MKRIPTLRGLFLILVGLVALGVLSDEDKAIHVGQNPLQVRDLSARMAIAWTTAVMRAGTRFQAARRACHRTGEGVTEIIPKELQ